MLVEGCDLGASCDLDQQMFKGIFVRNLRWQMGQTVEKPQGLSGKTSPWGESEAKGFSENPEAFRLSRGRSFSDNPKAFQQFVRLWFSRGAGTDLP